MPPRWLRKGSPTALKKCSEFRVDVCDTEKADGCCGVIPCAYCIEWNPETGDTVYAMADFATNAWAATIAGAAWLGFWERNYETGECEFVVTLDGVEIYRKSCYEGQSCRDSSDSAGATIGEVSGVISWTKYERRPLQYVQDEETNCTVHFCDDCECSVECLCVTITEPDSTETKGEICDTAYDCEPPLWAGTVGAFDLSIALGRDEYGRCIITGTVGEEEAEPVLFPGCADASATITLYDGTTIEVTAKKCGCAASEGCPCCPGWPLEKSANIYFSSIEESVNDCVPIIALQEYSDTFGCTGTALNYPIFQNVGNLLFVRVTCDPETLEWIVEYKSLATGMVANDPDTGTWVPVVYDFVCPDCADAIDGVAYGSFDFVAVHACETSGGLVTFNVLVHADVEVQCV